MLVAFETGYSEHAGPNVRNWCCLRQGNDSSHPLQHVIGRLVQTRTFQPLVALPEHLSVACASSCIALAAVFCCCSRSAMDSASSFACLAPSLLRMA